MEYQTFQSLELLALSFDCPETKKVFSFKCDESRISLKMLRQVQLRTMLNLEYCKYCCVVHFENITHRNIQNTFYNVQIVLYTTMVKVEKIQCKDV